MTQQCKLLLPFSTSPSAAPALQYLQKLIILLVQYYALKIGSIDYDTTVQIVASILDFAISCTCATILAKAHYITGAICVTLDGRCYVRLMSSLLGFCKPLNRLRYLLQSCASFRASAHDVTSAEIFPDITFFL